MTAIHIKIQKVDRHFEIYTGNAWLIGVGTSEQEALRDAAKNMIARGMGGLNGTGEFFVGKHSKGFLRELVEAKLKPEPPPAAA